MSHLRNFLIVTLITLLPQSVELLRRSLPHRFPRNIRPRPSGRAAASRARVLA